MKSGLFSKIFKCLFFVLILPFIQSTSANIEGTLQIRINTQSKKETIEYVLNANRNLTYSLHFVDHAPAHLKTGMHVMVHRPASTITAPSTTQLDIKSTDIAIVPSMSAKPAIKFGPQKTVVILVNFHDDPDNQPWTVDSVRKSVFENVDGMFNEFSYGKSSLAGNVFGWITLPIDSTTPCLDMKNRLPWLVADAAAQNGINLSLYDHRVYMFPVNPTCDWTGSSSVGGNPSHTWINGTDNAPLIAHELGHSIGLYHSHFLSCDKGSNQGTCTRVEYGDFADTMGAPGMFNGPHFNAFQKEQLNWLSTNGSPALQTITASGSYHLDAYETFNSNVKALKVLKRNKADGSSDYYYLEFRQGIGSDSRLGDCTDCNYTKGVLIHQANSNDPDSSELLDMSPDGDKNSRMVALLPGQSFRDESAPGDVTFTVQSISPNEAIVGVLFRNTPAPTPVPTPTPTPTPSNCERAAPNLSVSPKTTLVNKGVIVSYTLTITNQDSAACGATTFNLGSNTSNKNMRINWNQKSIPANPGETVSTGFKAMTDKSAKGSTDSITVTATNAAASDYASSVVATVTVRK